MMCFASRLRTISNCTILFCDMAILKNSRGMLYYIWYMLTQGETPLKKTFLSQQNPTGQNNKINAVINGDTSLDSLRERQVKELRLKLAEKGLTLDLVLDKYKHVMEAKDVKYRGSDVLKALDSVSELLQIKDTHEDVTIRAMIQSKSASEITTTLIEITGKTQEYIKKLTEQQDT